MTRTTQLLKSLDQLDDPRVVTVRVGKQYTRFKHLDYNNKTFAHLSNSKRFEHLDFRDGFATVPKAKPSKRKSLSCKRSSPRLSQRAPPPGQIKLISLISRKRSKSLNFPSPKHNQTIH